MKNQKYFIILFTLLVFFLIHIEKSRGAKSKPDIETALQIIKDLIDRFGAVTNTQRDFGDFICWLNNWRSRDSYATANQMWDDRFSVEGEVHGRWYCCMKKD